MRRLLAVLFVAVVTAACSSGATSPSRAASASSTAIASASSAPSPSATAPQPPSPTPIVLPNSVDIAAAGSGVVWAYVGSSRLFRSTDRGTTWEERTPPPSLINGSIAFASAREGWALSAGSPATGCMAEGFEVWHTADAAATWESVYKDALMSAGCKTAIAFVDAQHGYIAASTRDTGSWVLRTTDGGRSWSASTKLDGGPASAPVATYLNRPGRVADFGDVLLVVASSSSPDVGTRTVFRSADRGATWSYATSAPLSYADLVFITPTRWLQLVPQDARETTDGGRTWHDYTTDYQQAAPVAPAVTYGDANTGYATVRGGIQRTTDGGAHWSPIRTPGT
jgi:photosystem II stability/assembly factor-like uncharacterized protein